MPAPPPAARSSLASLATTALTASIVVSSCGETWLYPIRTRLDASPRDAAVEAVPLDAPPRDLPTVTECPPITQWGFATLGIPGGVVTTGGDGGAIVKVTTAADLVLQADRDDKVVIQVEGLITLVEPVRVKSDKTIEGSKRGDGLVGSGLNLTDSSNIIIRRLTIGNALRTDAISLNNSRNVWIDHCELYSDLSQPDETYDGLVDITHGSDWVTVSWTVFRDHNMTSVIGHTNTPEAQLEDTGHLTVTFHHNWFRRTRTNNPRVRFGSVHVVNNLYEFDPTVPAYGVISQQSAQLLVEANVFKSVANPIVTTYRDPVEGTAWSVNNVFLPDVPLEPIRTKQWTPPYPYTADPPDYAEAVVTLCAGPPP